MARVKRRGPAARGGQRDPEFETIRAGLHGRPCPPGGNPFAHLDATYAKNKQGIGWPRIVEVFRSLPHQERLAIIHARRQKERRLR